MRTLLGILIVVIIALGGYWLLRGETGLPTGSTATSTTPASLSYSSSEYGVAFRYPSSYQLEERDASGSGERRHHIVTLIQKKDLPPPEGGEGPTTITIEMFQNNLDKQTTEGWIRNSSASNFKLSLTGGLSSTTVAGQLALSYTWDGLYQGDTIAIARPAYVYAFSVTYRDTNDPIRSDFQELLRTVTFTE